ncbi:MAG: hypothetical protein QOG26_1543 [Solirubrobacterales bacterium]|nr:hypothetical protein [Solirubrobacterales bacterium]
MKRRRIVILTAVATTTVAAAGCGGGSSSDTQPVPQTATQPPATTSTSTTQTQPQGAQAAALAGYRRYLAALSGKDGETACQMLVPAGTAGLQLPAKRESCGEGLSASIGHPAAGGMSWKGAKVVGTPTVKGSASKATIEADVASSYSDGSAKTDHVSVAMAFLDGAWVLEKPDPTLYRAIGSR